MTSERSKALGIREKYPTTISVSLSIEQKELLFDLAADLDTSVSTLVRETIEKELIGYKRIKHAAKTRKY